MQNTESFHTESTTQDPSIAATLPSTAVEPEGAADGVATTAKENVGNTSGQGKNAVVPPEIKGWCWGAFLLSWIWAVSNRVWIGLLCFVPWIGIIAWIYLGLKGRELAWRKKKWESVEHFNAVQRKWSAWGIGITVSVIVIDVIVIAWKGIA